MPFGRDRLTMFSRFHLASDAASFQTASNPAIGASSTCSSGRRVVPKARRMPMWSSSAQDLDIPRTDLFEGACHLQQCSSQHGTPMRGSRCCTVLARRFGMKLRKRWPGGRRGQQGGSDMGDWIDISAFGDTCLTAVHSKTGLWRHTFPGDFDGEFWMPGRPA